MQNFVKANKKVNSRNLLVILADTDWLRIQVLFIRACLVVMPPSQFGASGMSKVTMSQNFLPASI